MNHRNDRLQKRVIYNITFLRVSVVMLQQTLRARLINDFGSILFILHFFFNIFLHFTSIQSLFITIQIKKNHSKIKSFFYIKHSYFFTFFQKIKNLFLFQINQFLLQYHIKSLKPINKHNHVIW
jgi:hypothetical protein